MSSLIPFEYRRDICRIGQGSDCCRYIVGSAFGLECAKHQFKINDEIDRRVAAGMMRATGDNCEGLKDD